MSARGLAVSPVLTLNCSCALVSARVVVAGGLQPGQSTTAVAALCAEYVRAPRVLYCTNVDGVYTADPSKDPNARKLNKVSYGKLRDLCCGTDNVLPGQYRIMDNVALTILERSKIEAAVMAGDRAAILDAVNRDFATIDENTADCGTIVCDVTIEKKK